MQEISDNWDNIVSVINADLPTLKAANPSIYAQATSVIGGTEVTQDFDVDLVQHVATGIDSGLMNAVLSRAGVEGVTLDGKEIPTDDNADSASDSQSSATSESDEAATEQDSDSSSSNTEDDVEDSDASDETEESEESDESDESESDGSSSEEDDDDTGNASALVAAPLAAGVAVIAAAFF
ncbi:hypothetical protein COEREDRAFT_83768 [Coemansia reversa NRRL 1564]|uniref:Uncharacterized protein n=1 Tax=Coemansia reversa (strain ATCC 12441 / NRRL 1564) TaxID=763665 RepID=A0A2G5B1X2_COERN|nr:hypothetical protein COEREDRAFT_83768 [Coemansia reversa NRRL 1564]|eukprot:PIA13004.1 hypothetical protein COEREDRAFT_83768 [Coemansia reversa NRRL 1564]